MASTKQIEDYLQKIRRLPSNKTCANCGAQSRLGFGAVCVKYQSFVCDLCKSAHQSYSHRTKSVTMSTWTLEEVKALDEKSEGGNDWCRARWFARLSESEAQRWMPKEGDPLDNYKRFVHMAYEEAKWLDESSKPVVSGTTSSGAPLAKAASEPTKPSSKQPSMAAKKSAPKPVEEDLLILDFDNVTVSAPTTPPVAASTGQMVDEWGSFTDPSPMQTRAKETPALSDDWTFHSAPAPLPAPSQPVLNNLAQLYQPQAPVMPAFNFGAGPSKAPINPMVGAISSTQVAVGSVVNDPFAQLHSYHSAPTQVPLNRASSTTNGNAAPTIVGSVPLGVQRSSSAPITNDPFAGLI